MRGGSDIISGTHDLAKWGWGAVRGGSDVISGTCWFDADEGAIVQWLGGRKGVPEENTLRRRIQRYVTYFSSNLPKCEASNYYKLCSSIQTPYSYFNF